MTFAAHASRTMARAIPVEDTEFALKRPFRREKLIEMSRRYIADLEAERNREEAKEIAIRKVIENAKRKHIRTRHLIKEPRTHHDAIIAMVAAWHTVTVKDVMNSSCRRHEVVIARRDAIIAVWTNCILEMRKPTTVSMGRAFKVDHTSILHALRVRGEK